MARGNPLGNREVFIEGYEKGLGCLFPGPRSTNTSANVVACRT